LEKSFFISDKCSATIFRGFSLSCGRRFWRRSRSVATTSPLAVHALRELAPSEAADLAAVLAAADLTRPF
jgi:hypothetical protein